MIMYWVGGGTYVHIIYFLSRYVVKLHSISVRFSSGMVHDIRVMIVLLKYSMILTCLFYILNCTVSCPVVVLAN